MPPRVSRAPLLLLLLSLAALAQDPPSPDAPRDDAVLDVRLKAEQDLEVHGLLQAWSRRFGGALVLPTPNASLVRVRLATPIDGPLSWGAVKAILALHDLFVVESQPTPGSPWVIRVWDRRKDPQAREQLPPGRVVGPEDLPPRDELVTAVIPVRHGAGAHIFGHVRALTMTSAQAPSMLYIPGAEVIVLVDVASRVRQVARLVEALDIPGPRRELEVIQAHHAPVERLAATLTGVLATLAQQAQPGSVLGGAQGAPPAVFADARTNKLVVSALAIDLAAVRRMIEELDVRVEAPAGRMHIYRCREAEAKELAARVNELLGAVAAPGAAAGAPPGGGVNEVRTRVIADEGTNSLVVQAEEEAWREVLSIASALDVRRRRVLIEAEVYEVFTPIDQLSLGVELLGLDPAADGSLRPAGATSFGLSSVQVQTDAQGNPVRLGRLPTVGTGLTAILTKDAFDRLPLIVRAVHSYEHARLLTRPFAVTNDAEKSSFQVADQVPYLTQELTSGGAASTKVDYADATTQLTITPKINSDETLTLELQLDISSFSGAGSPGLPPGKNTRNYQGKVTVQNGRYAVFGGLESETERTVENKVPLLGDIPVLGHLFKSWSRTRTRTRLYVFIRPVVFSEATPGAERRTAEALRARILVEAGRDEWLPPLVPDRVVRGLDLEDEAFQLFGTGSADPVRRT